MEDEHFKGKTLGKAEGFHCAHNTQGCPRNISLVGNTTLCPLLLVQLWSYRTHAHLQSQWIYGSWIAAFFVWLRFGVCFGLLEGLFRQ